MNHSRKKAIYFDIRYLLQNIPLRIAITDFCNLNCIFCSNEGMDFHCKNACHVDPNSFEYIVRTLISYGLEHVTITGGEPFLHPKFYEILDFLLSTDLKKIYIHTNGTILINPEYEEKIRGLAKFGISIHASKIEQWNELTKGNNHQFENIFTNLKLLSRRKNNRFLEIKHIPIRNINSSIESIQSTINISSELNAKFKFLILEPILKNDISKIVFSEEIISQLETLGYKEKIDEACFRNQKSYLPIQKMVHGKSEGTIIGIGCGIEENCKSCYKSNEIFITPDLFIKPCHINQKKFFIGEYVRSKDDMSILKSIIESRKFLYQSPGKGAKYWQDFSNLVEE